MIIIQNINQACNLCDALHRNINDNFNSISFEILENGLIQVKFSLKKMSETEEESIEDILIEFSSKQEKDCFLRPMVEVGVRHSPLRYVVYQREK